MVDAATVRESREGFRQLVNENFDEPQRTRVWQLLEAVVFSEQPILRGLEYFEVRSGSGAPTTTLYPNDGYGIYIDETASEAYVVLQWQGQFLFVGGSGTGSLPVISHLTNIADVGTETHAGIDTHIADATIHYTLPVINYAYVSGIDAGTNVTAAELEQLSDGSETALHIHDGRYYTETEIDTMLSDGTIDHGTNSGLGDDDHPQYILVDGSRAFTGDVEIYSASDPTLTLAAGGSGAFYTTFIDKGSTFYIRKKVPSGVATIFIDPDSPDNSRYVSLFRNVNSANSAGLLIYKGDGSATLQHHFYGDSGNAYISENGVCTIGAGYTGGTEKLIVVGAISFSITTQTGATLALDETHHTILLDGGSNAVTSLLPTAVGCRGRKYNFKSIDDTYACEIEADGSEEIDGSTVNISLSLMETVSVQSDNVNWWIVP